jgi:hypothetical protein
MTTAACGGGTTTIARPEDAGVDVAQVPDASADTWSPPEAGVVDTGSPPEAAVEAAVESGIVDAGLPLPAVGSGHLQLWVTADRGVTCVNNEIAAWADQSGLNRPVTSGSHKGPQCPTSGHSLAGVNLPYFSAPGTTPPFNDETLDIDLRFLAHTDFTIFAVERRWADGLVGGHDEMIIGTDVPNEISMACPAAGDQINLGYVFYDGYPALDFESVCYQPYSGTRGPSPLVPSPPPIAASYDMVRLWQANAASPTVWQNGTKINVGGASGGPGSGFAGGGIGRAIEQDGADMRFIGDIAEIVVFDVALTDAERLQMEAYFKQHWQLP